MTILSKWINDYTLYWKARILAGLQFAGFQESPEELATVQEIESDLLFESFEDLKVFLRSTKLWEIPDLFSPDKSLLAAYVYGENIHEYIQQLQSVLEGLMMDTLIDHDQLVQTRKGVFLKAQFFVNGRIHDPPGEIRALRDIAIRLVEGYELRRLHPELGLNTYQNLLTTRQILPDVGAFFEEIFRGHRTATISGSGTDRHRGT